MILSDKVKVLGTDVEIAIIFNNNTCFHDSGAELKLNYNETVKCFEVNSENDKHFVILIKHENCDNIYDLVAEASICFFKILNFKHNGKKDIGFDELSKEIYGYSFSEFLFNIKLTISKLLNNIEVKCEEEIYENEDNAVELEFDPNYDSESMKG